MDNVQAIMGEVRHIEDDACLGALSGLPQCGSELACAGLLTAGVVIELMERASSGRSPRMRLDTAFLSLSDFMRLHGSRGLPAGAEAPHRNALRADGRSIIGHKRIPAGHAYLTEFAHGPELVRGPTVLRCGEERIDVEHYCHALPARAERRAPVGLAVRRAQGWRVA